MPRPKPPETTREGHSGLAQASRRRVGQGFKLRWIHNAYVSTLHCDHAFLLQSGELLLTVSITNPRQLARSARLMGSTII